MKLVEQAKLLLPAADSQAELTDLTERLVMEFSSLEPFGNGNPQPVLRSNGLTVMHVRKMGAESQHVKLETRSPGGVSVQLLAFNAPPHFFVEPGTIVDVWYHPDINEWMGKKSVEGKLLHLVIQ